MAGHTVAEYGAPLFFAWQLTNRCAGRCIACCEESGPDAGWRDELSRDEACDLARRIVDFGIPYVAFGGGEPLGVPHCWELFELLHTGGVALKIETDGTRIDDAAADHLARLEVQCVQVSVDGATRATHEQARPGISFESAIDAIRKLAVRGLAPQFVFVPTRLNVRELRAAYDLSVELGCGAFVTGPLMRIGRATANWDRIACTDEEWQTHAQALREHVRMRGTATTLSIYPWDILTEMRKRRASPQAMLLVVPNGKVKLLNALPFAPADLRRDSLEKSWQAYRDAWHNPSVHEFIERCCKDPRLLQHANETWKLNTAAAPGDDAAASTI